MYTQMMGKETYFEGLYMSEFFETSHKNMFILASVPNTINSVEISKNHPTFSGDIILFMHYL